MKKQVSVLVLIFTIVLTSSVTLAATNSKIIKATLESAFKVMYKGELKQLKDSSGKAQSLISYNGVIYAPLNALASATGITMEVDKKTSTIYLDGRAKQAKTLIPSSVIKTGTNCGWIIKNKADLSVTPDEAESPVKFSNGMMYRFWNATGSANSDDAVSFNVEGYNELTATAFCNLTSYIVLYDNKGAKITEIEVPAKTLTPICVDISGFKSVSIAGKTAGYDGTNKDCLKVFDLKVSPTAATGTTKEVVTNEEETSKVDTEKSTATSAESSEQGKTLIPSNVIKTGTNCGWLIKNKADLSVTPDGAESPAKFSNGMMYRFWNATGSANSDDAVGFKVEGYDELTATAFCNIASYIVLYDSKGTKITEIEVPAKTLTPISVDISGMKSISIAGKSAGYDGSNKDFLKVFDLKVSKTTK